MIDRLFAREHIVRWPNMRLTAGGGTAGSWAMNTDQNNLFGLRIARKIVSCKENEWPDVVYCLYRTKQLSTAIHEINNLQSDPDHSDVATAAIKRMGFH